MISEQSLKIPENNFLLKFSDKGKEAMQETQIQESRKQLDSDALFMQIANKTKSINDESKKAEANSLLKGVSKNALNTHINESKKAEVNGLLSGVSKYALYNRIKEPIQEQPEKVDMDKLYSTFAKKALETHESQNAEELRN